MNLFVFLLCVLNVNALPTVIPTVIPTVQRCGNGISCAESQTCMSNASATGAGLVFACSPLSNAVRCVDARFSCPVSSSCVEDNKCRYLNGSLVDTVTNLDAFQVDKIRDFGAGMKPTSLSVCGAITNHFRLPNFCRCSEARLGGHLSCSIGLQTFIIIGASAWILPCASPANFGYRAWASLLGVSSGVGRTWTASFTAYIPIPGTFFELGVTNVGARAEISGVIRDRTISTQLAIGVCGRAGIGFFSKELCNPSIISWLPVTILIGPRYDFSRFC